MTDRRVEMVPRRESVAKIDSPVHRATALETAINPLRPRHGQNWASFCRLLRENS
jgi:hypothetical protein